MASRGCTIVDGPSLMEIMIALFDRENPRRRVAFSIEVPELRATEIFRFVINRMEREDGSGLRWNLEGFLPDETKQTSSRVVMYYNAQTRKGHVEVTLG